MHTETIFGVMYVIICTITHSARFNHGKLCKVELKSFQKLFCLPFYQEFEQKFHTAEINKSYIEFLSQFFDIMLNIRKFLKIINL